MRPLLASCLLLSILAGCNGQPARSGPNADYIGLKSFLRHETDYYQWDEVVGHVHKPQAERFRRWGEHADGSFILKTNNLGFRENLPTPAQKAPGTVRVLVTGDSHTDGVVPNEESFANVLEGMLAERHAATFEVINGGVGHYGPYNYPRLLEKFGPQLSPDLYLVNFYVGNDFLDACRILENAEGVGIRRPGSYMKTLQKAAKKLGIGISQGMNQAFYFAHFPDMANRALDFATEELLRTRSIGESLGIPVVVTLLPTKVFLEWPDARRRKAADIMGLDLQQLAINERLAGELCSRLAAGGMECLDLAPPLRRHQGPLYWNYDHHLGTTGHRAVAEIIAETYAEKLAGLARGATQPSPAPSASESSDSSAAP